VIKRLKLKLLLLKGECLIEDRERYHSLLRISRKAPLLKSKAWSFVTDRKH